MSGKLADMVAVHSDSSMPLDRRDFGGILVLTSIAGRRPEPRERPCALQAP